MANVANEILPCMDVGDDYEGLPLDINSEQEHLVAASDTDTLLPKGRGWRFIVAIAFALVAVVGIAGKFGRGSVQVVPMPVHSLVSEHAALRGRREVAARLTQIDSVLQQRPPPASDMGSKGSMSPVSSGQSLALQSRREVASRLARIDKMLQQAPPSMWQDANAKPEVKPLDIDTPGERPKPWNGPSAAHVGWLADPPRAVRNIPPFKVAVPMEMPSAGDSVRVGTPSIQSPTMLTISQGDLDHARPPTLPAGNQPSDALAEVAHRG